MEDVDWAKALQRVKKLREESERQQKKFWDGVLNGVEEREISWETKNTKFLVKGRQESGKIFSVLDSVLTGICRKRAGQKGRLKLVE